jgi:hypothetical protein
VANACTIAPTRKKAATRDRTTAPKTAYAAASSSSSTASAVSLHPNASLPDTTAIVTAAPAVQLIHGRRERTQYSA